MVPLARSGSVAGFFAKAPGDSSHEGRIVEGEEASRLEGHEKQLISQISSCERPLNASVDDDTGTQFLDALLMKE